jgi:hypothetical protein
MNTIIPNKLSFNLGLNDLPARASEISEEGIKLLGGVEATRVTCVNANTKLVCNRFLIRSDAPISPNSALDECGRRFPCCSEGCTVRFGL